MTIPPNVAFRWQPSALDGKVDPAVVDAITQAFYRLAQQDATLKAMATAQMATQGRVAEVATSVASAQSQLAQVAAVGTIAAGQSTLLKNQGSALPVFSGAFSYVSTTTTITWYWDGTNGSTLLTLLWPDGSKTPIIPGSLAISGLTLYTTYLFYPFANPQTNTINFVIGLTSSVGTPAAAYTAANPAAAQQAYGDGLVPMTVGAMSAATTASGGGGGSGGGSGGGGRTPTYL